VIVSSCAQGAVQCSAVQCRTHAGALHVHNVCDCHCACVYNGVLLPQVLDAEREGEVIEMLMRASALQQEGRRPAALALLRHLHASGQVREGVCNVM
jgi:hypothetical protein